MMSTIEGAFYWCELNRGRWPFSFRKANERLEYERYGAFEVIDRLFRTEGYARWRKFDLGHLRSDLSDPEAAGVRGLVDFLKAAVVVKTFSQWAS